MTFSYRYGIDGSGRLAARSPRIVDSFRFRSDSCVAQASVSYNSRDNFKQTLSALDRESLLPLASKTGTVTKRNRLVLTKIKVVLYVSVVSVSFRIPVSFIVIAYRFKNVFCIVGGVSYMNHNSMRIYLSTVFQSTFLILDL